MKKVISISLTCLMLLALLRFSVATHYCMGSVAASRISFSGQLATCGMENDENEQPQPGSSYHSHCCDNLLVFCGINSNYFPTFTFVPESYNNDFQVFSMPIGLAVNSISSFQIIKTPVYPPGVSAIKSVDLSDICVFRI
jgi:hypothetical protein